jgi:hypothetical protein
VALHLRGNLCLSVGLFGGAFCFCFWPDLHHQTTGAKQLGFIQLLRGHRDQPGVFIPGFQGLPRAGLRL